MKKVFYFVLTIIMLSHFMSCKNNDIQQMQGDLDAIPYTEEDEERWGLVNMNGEIIVEREWRSQPSIGIDGVVRVENSDNYIEYYLISSAPKQIGNEYVDGTLFSDGIAAVVEENSSISFINKAGELLFDLIEDSDGTPIEKAGVFSDGLVSFMNKEGKWGYVDRNGNFVVEAVYDGATPYSDGLGLVSEWNEGKLRHEYIFIDKNGNETLELSREFFEVYPFSDGMAAFTDVSSKDEWGFLNLSGEEVIKPHKDFEQVRHFRSGIAPFFDGDDWGLINKKGETVLRTKFDQSLTQFYNGRAPYIDDSEYGFIDIDGELVIEPRFSSALPFFSSTTVVNYRDYYFIDSDGDETSDNEFDFIPIKDIISQYLGYKFELVSSDYYSTNEITSLIFKGESSDILGFKLGSNVSEVMGNVSSEFELPQNDTTVIYNSGLQSTSAGISYRYRLIFDQSLMIAKKETVTQGSGYYAKTVYKTIGYEINPMSELKRVHCVIELSGKALKKTSKISNDIEDIINLQGFRKVEGTTNDYIKNDNIHINFSIKYNMLEINNFTSN